MQYCPVIAIVITSYIPFTLYMAMCRFYGDREELGAGIRCVCCGGFTDRLTFMSAVMRDGKIWGCMSLWLPAHTHTHIQSDVKSTFSALFDSKTTMFNMVRIKFFIGNIVSTDKCTKAWIKKMKKTKINIPELFGPNGPLGLIKNLELENNWGQRSSTWQDLSSSPCLTAFLHLNHD